MTKKLSEELKPSHKYESRLWDNGLELVCGVDEAGRGALAGPLVAAAVILPKRRIYRLRDSKTISEAKRNELSIYIKKIAISFATGIAPVEFINNFGIQASTYMAFKQAIEKLSPSAEHALIDYYKTPNLNIPQTSITHGDKISQSIAAASIIAKTTRDALMKQLSQNKIYRPYEFQKNFGYGTLLHRTQIEKVGVSNVHRLSYGNLGRFKEKQTKELTNRLAECKQLTFESKGTLISSRAKK